MSEETGECESRDYRHIEPSDSTNNNRDITTPNNNTTPQNNNSIEIVEESSQYQSGSSRNQSESYRNPTQSHTKSVTEVNRTKSFGTSDFLQRYSGVRELPPLTQRPAAPVIQVSPYNNKGRMSEVEKEEVRQLSPHTYRSSRTLLLTELNDKVKTAQANGEGPSNDEHVHAYEAVSNPKIGPRLACALQTF